MRTYLYRITALVLLLLLAVSSVEAGGFTPYVLGLTWSPDGKSLLYTVYKKGTYVVTLDGEPQRIADLDYFDRSPQWSPDGKFIIQTLEVNDQAGIFRTPLDGGEPMQLTEDVGWRPQYYAPNGMVPRVSPDGKWIAFLSLREGDADTSLYLMTFDGKGEIALTHDLRVDDMVWSPNSQSIAFSGGPADNSSGDTDYIYSVGLSGGAPVQLTTESSAVLAWTPDSQHILFDPAADDSPSHIDMIDSDGQNRKTFITYGEGGYYPIISPDLGHIVYSSPDDNWDNLAIMSTSEPESDPVTIKLPGAGEYAYYAPAWSPDGSQLAFVGYDWDGTKTESIYLVGADGLDPQVWVADPESSSES